MNTATPAAFDPTRYEILNADGATVAREGSQLAACCRSLDVKGTAVADTLTGDAWAMCRDKRWTPLSNERTGKPSRRLPSQIPQC